MEDIAIVGDQQLLFEAKLGSGPDPPTIRRKESYFVLKAERGAFFSRGSLRQAVKVGRGDQRTWLTI